MTKILTINEAYELYVLLKPTFPESLPEENLLDFLSDIVSRIRAVDDMILVEAVSLLSGLETDKIIEMEDGNEFLEMLIDGFVENRIINLMDFFDGIIK